MKARTSLLLISLLSAGLVPTTASQGAEIATTDRVENGAPPTTETAITARPVANAGAGQVHAAAPVISRIDKFIPIHYSPTGGATVQHPESFHNYILNDDGPVPTGK